MTETYSCDICRYPVTSLERVCRQCGALVKPRLEEIKAAEDIKPADMTREEFSSFVDKQFQIYADSRTAAFTQRAIRWIGLIVAVLLFLFPPFHYPYHSFNGYHFLFSYRAQHGYDGRVDDELLLIELALVGIGFYLASAQSKE